MSKTLPQIFYTKRFIRETRIFRDWLDDNIQIGKGREFILELETFILEKIGPHPTRYMEWPYKRTPAKTYRRAIFNKRYILVFKNVGHALEFVLIYHQKRDPAKIRI